MLNDEEERGNCRTAGGSSTSAVVAVRVGVARLRVHFRVRVVRVVARPTSGPPAYEDAYPIGFRKRFKARGYGQGG